MITNLFFFVHLDKRYLGKSKWLYKEISTNYKEKEKENVCSIMIFL